jgi:hypothetical protein
MVEWLVGARCSNVFSCKKESERLLDKTFVFKEGVTDKSIWLKEEKRLLNVLVLK